MFVFYYLGVFLFCIVMSMNAALAGPFILVDVNSGKVLADDRPTDPWYPASITKLMTLYVAAKAVQGGELSLHSTLTMSRYASRTAPSKMGFRPGTEITIENALQMLVVKSANDMAVAIAERVGGSEKSFVARMNEAARSLGMVDSHFTNPHGLPSKSQHVTARDMAILGVAIHREFPELLPIFKIAGIRFGKRILRSHNLVLEHYRGATGMKTGFICAGGLNMVASAKRGNREYLVVILGELKSIDRAEKAALALERGFSGAFKKPRGKLASYRPAPGRAEPVNLRPQMCGGHRKIRALQIVVPQPKPKQGIFSRAKYTSPQRKDFGPNLGDKSHPQGALVQTPGRRAYRSHILQPRQAGLVQTVYSGPYRPDRKAPPFTIKVKEGHKRNNALEEIPIASASAVLPFPRPNPTNKPVEKNNTLVPVTASAFANAAAGTGAARPVKRSASLHEQALFRKKITPQTQADEEPVGGPLILDEPANGLPFPLVNPLR